MDSVAVLGSPEKPPDDVMKLCDKYRQVYVWLDWDKRKTSLNWCNIIRQTTGVKCTPIMTRLDPKCYTKEEVEEILNVNSHW